MEVKANMSFEIFEIRMHRQDDGEWFFRVDYMVELLVGKTRFTQSRWVNIPSNTERAMKSIDTTLASLQEVILENELKGSGITEAFEQGWLHELKTPPPGTKRSVQSYDPDEEDVKE